MKRLTAAKLSKLTPIATSRLFASQRISRAAIVLLLIGLIAVGIYTGSSASSFRESATKMSARSIAPGAVVLPQKALLSDHSSRALLTAPPNAPLPLTPPAPFVESVATFNADCVTPQTDFLLSETVCAKASGVPTSLFTWHVLWLDTVGFVRQANDASTDDTTTYLYQLPSTPTSTVNSQTVDNRGTWRVNLSRPNGAVRQTARFNVHDTANPASDVFIQKVQSNSQVIHAGDSVPFLIVVGNYGPDAAAAVHLVDSVPSVGTLNSFTQNSGPTCTPATGGPANDCTIATMANGDQAVFTVTYTIGTATAPGTYDTSGTVSSTTTDQNTNNNTSTALFVIETGGGGGGGGTCTVACPDDITTPANTVDQSNNPGAIVHFSPPSGNTECGTITVDHCNDCFFPQGSTIVTATSTSTGETCNFTVTVTPAGSSPTISCPANKTGDADNTCQAAINVGTATATGQNVTVVGYRSDGRPLYTCDVFGNCTRNGSDDPYSAGVTTITWYAYAHDVPGPYTGPVDGNGNPVNPADTEEGHRTGSATCRQTVTVNDVTPPVIAATDSSASADANCQAPIPDYSSTASDNCACSNSDNSEACQGHPKFTYTQTPAAGTLVGLGPHSVHIEVNDNSSNNNGAGNTTTKDVTFTVIDTTPPTFTFVPPMVTAYTGAGATTCDTVVSDATLGTPTATDNCSAVTITRSPTGNTFQVGDTTVVWSARDAAGNTSTANQTVRVIDNTPPQISCPANVGPLEPTCPSGAIATYTAPVGTDNCPGATTSLTAGGASGSVFPIGTTTVTYTVNDAHGNSASCSFTVTVKTVAQTLDDLEASVNASSLNGTQKQGLIAKLEAAKTALLIGHTQTACSKLLDFIGSTQTYIDHGNISAAVGNAWITTATHLRNAIGCTSDPCS